VEVDLLVNYPVTNRSGIVRTEEDRKVARRFGREFFDGKREQGYGGYRYDPKYWAPVVPLFLAYYELGEGDSVLDVGCAKGFMLHEFRNLGLNVSGLDISEYAVSNAMPGIDPYLGDARDLPFPDKSFDLVVSLGTIHNLDRPGVIKALGEIERVGKNAFVTVDSFRNAEEKKRMAAWNLTARTVLHTLEWEELFEEAGYTGDWSWIIV
jgi:SAM-dependent methyltransferase